MDLTAVHIFVLLVALGRPATVDLYEHTFDTMRECGQYVEDHPDDIMKAVGEMRLLMRDVPDGAPIEVHYGCRGKEKVDT